MWISKVQIQAHGALLWAGSHARRAVPARALRAYRCTTGRAGTARSPIGPGRATGQPGRATTMLRAEGAAHGPARGPFFPGRAARSARSGRANSQPGKHLMS